MEEKVVKFEIGKVLAVIITVVAVALVASALIRSDYFKGSVSNCIEPNSGSPAEMWAAYNDCLTRESVEINPNIGSQETVTINTDIMDSNTDTGTVSTGSITPNSDDQSAVYSAVDASGALID